MNTRKKLWTAIASFALVLVVSATAVGVTIAALQAQVGSGFSISYTAHNVNCVILGLTETKAICQYSTMPGAQDGNQYATVEIGKTVLTSNDGKHIEFTGKEESKSFNGYSFEFDSSYIEKAKAQVAHKEGVDMNDFSIFVCTPQIWFTYIFISFDSAEMPVKLNINNFVSNNIELAYILTISSKGPAKGYEQTTPPDDIVLTASGFNSSESIISTCKQAFAESPISWKDVVNDSELLTEEFGWDISGDELAVAALLLSYASEIDFTKIDTIFSFESETVSTNISGNFNFTIG